MHRKLHSFKRATHLRAFAGAGLVATAVAFAAPQPLAAKSAALDPIQLYGPEIVFDVYRKGERVGRHHVKFDQDGDTVVAESRFDVKIKVLSLTVYEYLYTSRERWKNGQLVSLQARTDDDGDVTKVNATRTGYALMVDNGIDSQIVSADTYPTTHWNAGVLGATRVINTITGNINDVTIENRGTVTVQTGDIERQATHYAYQGDLTTEVWYDDDGRWVKMRFPGSDGTMIEYRCVRCGPTAGVQSGSAGARPEIARQHSKED